MSYQQSIIIGNLGRDPELRYTQTGAAVCSFSVAVSESWTDRQTSEKREKTTWFRVSVWGNQAISCNTFLRKGSQVMVVGTVDASAYVNKAGEAAASLELKARDVKFLSGKPDGAGGDYAPPPDGIEDIPF